ncbi:MAG: 2-isopropylmalate synthase [Alphaproteobacteria bacterium]
MLENPASKYKPFPPLSLPKRQWPDNVLTEAPVWCSVDLRDGNQALINPMDAERKLELWRALVGIGFKEIEVGFPSASETDFDFVRQLIDEDMIPDDVTIQVLTQARESLINRTFEAIKGSKNAIVHLYNSTSTLQRRVVFRAEKADITKMAVEGTKLIKSLVETLPDTNIRLQYSPESFTGTEIDYAVEICTAVCDVWQPSDDNKIIINLPSTVEMATPNIYADQIEMFCRDFSYRDQSIISLHTHNDRGTGVAATELGLMAGGDRVEGTLFGNGERTGNLDLVTVALNLYTQGVSPNLDFSNISILKGIAERCTELTIHERHPYAGELAFTAFSGSHQDAIKKGIDDYNKASEGNTSQFNAPFEVPYITIDPADIGRGLDPIIRVNSQSGKGGVAFLVEQELGYKLPRILQIEFTGVVQKVTDTTSKEISPAEICDLFVDQYVNVDKTIDYHDHTQDVDADRSRVQEAYVFTLDFKDARFELKGSGSGLLDSFLNGIREKFDLDFDIIDYSQHAMTSEKTSLAASYVRVKDSDGNFWYGVGHHANVTRSSLVALVNAINCSFAKSV